MSKKERITWIDTVKGIAIILLLLSHSISEIDWLKTWIFSFMLPTFFIICGYLNYYKQSDSIKTGQIKELLKNRWYNIGIPYFFFGIILIAFLNILRYISGETVIAVHQLFDLILLKGIESMWFLPIYFLSELLFVVLQIITKDNHKRYKLYLILCISILLIIINQDILAWPLDLIYMVCEGLVFIYIGFLSADYKLENKISTRFAVMLLILASFSTTLNHGAAMNNMNNGFIYFFNATSISLCIIALIKRIDKRHGYNKIISFYGKNSLIVLCTNNLIIEIIRLIDFKLTNNSLLHMGYLGVFIFFIIITICEYPLLKIFEGKFKRPRPYSAQ